MTPIQSERLAIIRKYLTSPSALLAGLLILVLLIRLAGLFQRPIWYDEAFSLLFASKGPAAMLTGTLGSGVRAAEEHPLLYYTLLWGWIRAFGESIPAARLFSILAGLATVALAWKFSQLIFRRVIWGIGLLLALSPFLVHYTQEIRMYALLAMFTTAATLALWQGMHTHQKRWWLIFSVCAACAMYTHALAVVYLAPLALIPFLQRRWRDAQKTIAATFAAVLLYTPWLIRLPAQIGKIQSGYWIEPPGVERLITTLLHFVVNLPLPGATLLAGLTITLIALAFGLMQTITARKNLPEETRHAAWLLYLAFAPPVLLFTISQWQPVFIERALLPSGVMFTLWLGWALFETPMPAIARLFTTGLTAAGMMMGIGIHLSYNGFPYAPYTQMTHFLEQNIQPGDLIIHSSKLTALPLVYQAPSLPQTFINDPPDSGTNTLAESTQRVLGVTSAATLEDAAANKARLWLVIFDKSIQEYQQAGYATHPHLAWLEEHAHQQEMRPFGEVYLYLYIKP